MNAERVERLFLKNGEEPTDEHLRALDRLIDSREGLRTTGLRRRVLPWGTHTHIEGDAGGVLSMPKFRPSVTITGEGALVRWSGEGLIAGLPPKVGETSIFAADDGTGHRPAFAATLAMFEGADQLGIYFQVETSPGFVPLRVTVAAFPALPRVPWQAHKLALFLRLRGGKLSYREDDDRQLFSSQRFEAINRRSTGLFEPLWWPTF